MISLDRGVMPNIIYYNDDHHNGHYCTKKLSSMMSATWTMPGTWNELVNEIEGGGEFVAFHIDMILKSKSTSIVEFIDAITTIVKFIPGANKTLKIGVVINPCTPFWVIKALQKTAVQGVLLDINHYSVFDVKSALTALVNGKPHWPKNILNKLPRLTKRKSALPAGSGILLTTRQEQVFRLIKDRGASNKTIAKILGISESTVKLHVTGVFKKYGVRNRTQLAVLTPD